jgi:hypothetical protein
VARLRRVIDNLSRAPEDIRADNLRHWASTIEGAIPLAQVEPRTRVKVAGVVQNIRIDPREGTGAVEATIIDGSGYMVVRWLGRSSMRGVRLGVGLVVEGVAGRSQQGEPTLLNPEYTLIPGPEHG